MSDPQINPETGESMVERSPRFIHWIAFLVFSIITLGSAVQVVRGRGTNGIVPSHVFHSLT